MNIFLDDDSNRWKRIKPLLVGETTKHVKTAKACIKAIEESEEISILFLDHDLGGETYVESNREDYGMEVVRWIAEHQPIIRNIIVHTMNPAAGRDMVQTLKRHQYKVTNVPFGTLIRNLEAVNGN